MNWKIGCLRAEGKLEEYAPGVENEKILELL